VLRITRINATGDPETVKLEGRVAGPWVDELSRVVGRSLAESRRVVLDLSGVTFVDRDGIAVLRSLRARRAKLHGSSTFVAALLNGGLE
jgi:anti-anti-sigma regulatory factor